MAYGVYVIVPKSSSSPKGSREKDFQPDMEFQKTTHEDPGAVRHHGCRDKVLYNHISRRCR